MKDNNGKEHSNVGVPRSSEGAGGLPFGADFDEWYRVFPRKKERKLAHRKYVARRREGVSKADLLTAARNYRQETSKTEQRYIKHAATFLGPDEHWREYLEEIPDDGVPLVEDEADLLEGVVN